MALTILPQEMGFGTGLGTGLGGILEGLAEQKAKKMAQQAYQTTFNLPPEVAQSIANLPPQAQQEFIKNYYARGGIQPAQQKQAMAEQQALAARQGTQKPDVMQGLQGEQQDINQVIQQLGGQQDPTYPAGFDPESMTYTQPAKTYEEFQQRIPEKQLQQQRARQRAEEGLELQRRKVDQAERKIDLQQQKYERQAVNESGKNRLERFKLSKGFREQVLSQGEAAENRLDDLNRMEELEETNKLDDAGWNAFFERSGLDIPALRSPESQEFNKIAANFIKDARQTFGSRVTNFELESFLKTIPALSQTPEGRKRVIANLKRIARFDKARSKIMKNIIRNNDGDVPLDIEEEVSDRMKKVRDKNAIKFKKDLQKPVPEGPSKLKTVTGAALGSIASSLPGALKGAAAGATLGALRGAPMFGAPGAIGGGLAGAGLGALGLLNRFF